MVIRNVEGGGGASCLTISNGCAIMVDAETETIWQKFFVATTNAYRFCDKSAANVEGFCLHLGLSNQVATR